MFKRVISGGGRRGHRRAGLCPAVRRGHPQVYEHRELRGADLALATHGPLSLAVLNPDSTINGGYGYNNEKVGVTTSGATNGSQDFTVFQDEKTAELPGQGGVYGYGDYVVMYTPGGVKAPLGDPNYCVSVEDTYPTVAGKTVQRWALVLRNCAAMGAPRVRRVAPSAATPRPRSPTPTRTSSGLPPRCPGRTWSSRTSR